MVIDQPKAIYFINTLRDARAMALKDSESFEKFILILEQLGKLLCGIKIGLFAFTQDISKLASQSDLAKEIPFHYPELHNNFDDLYRLVKDARNDAVHEGAFARHLTIHLIELSIILEDSLMSNLNKVCEYMVRNPVCAELWQPLSFIRQTMLANSFSYLPVQINNDGKSQWKLVSDTILAKYLNRASSKTNRRVRLIQSLQEAVEKKILNFVNL
jgi:hypothetical protein